MSGAQSALFNFEMSGAHDSLRFWECTREWRSKEWRSWTGWPFYTIPTKRDQTFWRGVYLFSIPRVSITYHSLYLKFHSSDSFAQQRHNIPRKFAEKVILRNVLNLLTNEKINSSRMSWMSGYWISLKYIHWLLF